MDAFPYSELTAMMPLARIVEALDDDRDGEADAAAWTDVLAGVDERLADIYGTAAAAAAANPAYARKVFCCEVLYARRGFHGEEQNPWTRQANALDRSLRQRAAGDGRPVEGGGTVFADTMGSRLSGGGLLQ